ncbi:cob(I)yrinic acid a,c-diamide adenosyltransferase [Gloeomargarita lithophora Alchichica-D10]|uniref:Cob(I)yrinic acid a,c-diamide adenosyltransferase n=1 Tax=Gloeomargarita lithophora Alchichica-D10 TaxID=1188229 RepID=A0A1J0ACI0_9CYAN|nr:cob(I)yrinic acid a,c-diamide adenosyltransferase [Gloeomargarita lithophora]APB33644.1 cob(I)yrinic acid a,c-diamide adenosyltransferase [Gloeomargarita lithophora Alchichica-D10]
MDSNASLALAPLVPSDGLPRIGRLQVYTAPQRTFFAEVMALAIRSAGHGQSVLIVQFLKGGIGQGARHPMKLVQHLDWIRCPIPRCIDTPDVQEEEAQAINQLWQSTQDLVLSGRYPLVVLDELILAVHLGLLGLIDVVSFLHQRPPMIDVIITGTTLPAEILALADQVTELRHPG